MYLLTLLSPMSMPSLSSSPWMRGAPQAGLSWHIFRIESRTSREMTGLSGLAALHLPGPEQTQAGTMPGNDRFWLGRWPAPSACGWRIVISPSFEISDIQEDETEASPVGTIGTTECYIGLKAAGQAIAHGFSFRRFLWQSPICRI